MPEITGEGCTINIGITGSSGFLGWHLRSLLHTKEGAVVLSANEEEFQSDDLLKGFVSKSDVIIHLAGLMRAEEEEVFNTNMKLTRKLVKACDDTGSAPHIIFSNSIQYVKDNAYGKSKSLSWDLLADWAARTGGTSTNVILPNVFGEHGRPFYNSVVATFCYQVAHGEEPTIIEDNEIPLIHVRDVVETMVDCALRGVTGEVRPVGNKTLVSELLRKLRTIDDTYKAGMVPDLSDRFTRSLFNTYRINLFPSLHPVHPSLNEDERGCLFEAVKAHSGGQAFISTTKPGFTRGNHFHVGKFERFLIVQGKAVIKIRRVLFDEVHKFEVDGDSPGLVDIPTMHTHNMTNIGDRDLVALFWSDELYDPQEPDTYFETV